MNRPTCCRDMERAMRRFQRQTNPLVSCEGLIDAVLFCAVISFMALLGYCWLF